MQRPNDIATERAITSPGPVRPVRTVSRSPYISLIAAVVLIFGATSCRVARPHEIPEGEPWIVVVKSCRIPDWESTIAHFAHHTWFDLKLGDEEHWERVEVLSELSGVQQSHVASQVVRHDRRFEGREVRVLQTITGDRARAIAARIQELGRTYSDTYRSGYEAWPGPNSNTFVSDVAANTEGLSFPLHHNAVGKDYPGWFDAGLTTSKTGVRVDTLPIGLALGVEEGVELHLLQLTFGVSLFPPRLKLPFLPELPWASDVPARIPSPTDATYVMTVEDPEAIDYRTRTTLREPRGTFVVDYESAGVWTAVTIEPKTPDDATTSRSSPTTEGNASGDAVVEHLHVVERSCDGREVHTSERTVVANSSHVPLLVDSPLGEARASLTLERSARGAWALEFVVHGSGATD